MIPDYEVEEFMGDRGVTIYLVTAKDEETGVGIAVTGSDREETIQAATVELRRRVMERKLEDRDGR